MADFDLNAIYNQSSLIGKDCANRWRGVYGARGGGGGGGGGWKWLIGGVHKYWVNNGKCKVWACLLPLGQAVKCGGQVGRTLEILQIKADNSRANTHKKSKYGFLSP